MYGYSDHVGGGGNGGWILMLVMMVILILVVVAVLWYVMGNPRRRATDGPAAPPHATAEQLLAERLARGEIDPDEYRARMAALTEHKTGT